jgi:hypothetical protein
MKAMLTIRLDARQQRAIAAAARRQGKSTSAIVREALDRALANRPIATRAAHVEGALDLSSARGSAWRKTLKERNWRS